MIISIVAVGKYVVEKDIMNDFFPRCKDTQKCNSETSIYITITLVTFRNYVDQILPIASGL